MAWRSFAMFELACDWHSICAGNPQASSTAAIRIRSAPCCCSALMPRVSSRVVMRSRGVPLDAVPDSATSHLASRLGKGDIVFVAHVPPVGLSTPRAPIVKMTPV